MAASSNFAGGRRLHAIDRGRKRHDRRFVEWRLCLQDSPGRFGTWRREAGEEDPPKWRLLQISRAVAPRMQSIAGESGTIAPMMHTVPGSMRRGRSGRQQIKGDSSRLDLPILRIAPAPIRRVLTVEG